MFLLTCWLRVSRLEAAGRWQLSGLQGVANPSAFADRLGPLGMLRTRESAPARIPIAPLLLLYML